MSEVTSKAVKEKLVKIKLPRAAHGEDNFMMVSLNGKGYKIQRGKEVEVPEGIAEIIQDSLDARDKADDFIEENLQK